MELHPILERGDPPSHGLWYVLSALGDCPSMRVGHTCSYIPGPHGYGGKVYVVGGANPSGPFNETYVLDLETFTWDTCDHPGLCARYEHSAFIPKSQPDKLYVFGGAHQTGNHNDIQVLDLSTLTWAIVTPSGGTPPTARTYHNALCAGDKFIVYSGGQSGSDPVGDRQVHCFDAVNHSWMTLNVRGDTPKPRHGHLVVAVGNKIIIHGGMSGPTFYDDLHVLDLDRCVITHVKQKKVYPSARAAHGGVAIGSELYVFGGMNKDGALDDMYKLNTDTYKWTKVTIEGPPPACRLDFAMCHIRLRVPVTSSSDATGMVASGNMAKDVLDSQLRMGSAGSVRSLGSIGSAGSQRSASSACSNAGRDDTNTDGQTASAGPDSPDIAPVVTAIGEAEPCVAMVTPAADGVPMKLVDMALILGGMDTEGEIFDDCLVFLVNETLEDTPK